MRLSKISSKCRNIFWSNWQPWATNWVEFVWMKSWTYSPCFGSSRHIYCFVIPYCTFKLYCDRSTAILTCNFSSNISQFKLCKLKLTCDWMDMWSKIASPVTCTSSPFNCIMHLGPQLTHADLSANMGCFGYPYWFI